MSTLDDQIRAFLVKWDGVQETDEEDLLALIRGWEAQRNHLEAFVQDTHESLLEQEANEREQYPDEVYYTNAINQYAVDQDQGSLDKAAELLHQNIDQSYLGDGMLLDLCYEVVGATKPAVIPDDEP